MYSEYLQEFFHPHPSPFTPSVAVSPPPGSITHASGGVVVVDRHWSLGGVELSCQSEAGLWRMTIVRKLSVVQLHIKEDGRLFPVYQILQHGPNATTMTRKLINTINPLFPCPLNFPPLIIEFVNIDKYIRYYIHTFILISFKKNTIYKINFEIN